MQVSGHDRNVSQSTVDLRWFCVILETFNEWFAIEMGNKKWHNN